MMPCPSLCRSDRSESLTFTKVKQTVLIFPGAWEAWGAGWCCVKSLGTGKRSLCVCVYLCAIVIEIGYIFFLFCSMCGAGWCCVKSLGTAKRSFCRHDMTEADQTHTHTRASASVLSEGRVINSLVIQQP